MLEVRETNYCRISVHDDGRTGRILVFAAIDNLWKGAASQAVQNLNLMFGRDEREGLRVTLRLALGRAARRRHRVPEGGLAAGFRAAGRAPPGSSRRATPTSACSSPPSPTR